MNTAIAVQEKPILFSGAMVRKIIEDLKTNTRRVIKPQPELVDGRGKWRTRGDGSWPIFARKELESHLVGLSPYGKPGDRLWVREAFNVGWLDGGKVLYRADGGSAKEAGYPSEPVYKPSIHMPRWASRLTLEIVSVKVERVQDISEEDAQAEGIVFGTYDASEPQNYRAEFKRLWDSINAKREGGKYAWAANPWVWAIEFRRLDT